jgi:hypothetical protein
VNIYKEKIMKKKNLAIAVLSIATVACSAVALAGCGETESYYNLYESGTIYYEGEQTVKLSISEYSENKTTFKDSVTKDDITLSGVLEGKTVKDVSYVSATELSVVVDGAVTANSTQANDYGTITVANTAMANNATANCLAKVDFNPSVKVVGNSYGSIAGLVNCSSTFQLPYGSFISENVNTDNIIVPADDVEVTTTITDAGNLKITVNNYLPETDENGNATDTSKYPVAKISANVTTFNTDLYVYIGTGSYYGIKSTPATDEGDDDRLVTDGDTKYTRGLEFTLNSDGTTYSVSAYTKGNTAVLIPDTYNGKQVTAIADNVFRGRSDIKSVQLGKNITTIGSSAFDGCYKLANLICSDSNIKTIGSYAFKDCAFESINLPKVEKINAYAFQRCFFLQTVSLSTAITEIADGVFEDCCYLRTVKNVGELTSIGNEAFLDAGLVGINSDSAIDLGSKIKTIADSAFERCRKITEFKVNSSDYVSKDGVLYGKTKDGLTLIKYPANKSDSKYEIDENTVTIQKYAFLYADNLEAVKLYGNLTTISELAFSSCANLKIVLIGNNVKKIERGAFVRCTALEDVMIGTDYDVALEEIGANIFSSCSKLRHIIYSAYDYAWELIDKDSSWDKNTNYLIIITQSSDEYDDYINYIMLQFKYM